MAETTERILETHSEQAKVESWRLHVLMEAGYPSRSPSGWRRGARPTCTRPSAARAGLRAGHRGRDPALAPGADYAGPMKVEATVHGDRRSTRWPRSTAASPMARRGCPAWVEASDGTAPERALDEVFFTLKDPADGTACRPRCHADVRRAAARARGRRARPRLRPARAAAGEGGVPAARALHRAVRRGAHLAAIEQLKRRSPPRACSTKNGRGRCRACRAGSRSSRAAMRRRRRT